MDGALIRAKKAAGGNTGLSKALSKGRPPRKRISPQAISQWQKVPAERVLDVEHVTGVSRTELRPDLYPVGSAA